MMNFLFKLKSQKRCRARLSASMRTLLLTTLLVIFAAAATAQQRVRVSGNVKDDGGESVIGATVVVKGTNVGVVTDFNGNYSISFTNADATLLFSMLGYDPQEVKVGGQTKIDVVFTKSTTKIDDVVVIGYGTAKRQDIAGSVASPKMSDVIKAPVASIDEALAGRMAGVQVTSTEGQPGSEINIVIRGQNSLSQSNSPLYVVDGFPREDFNFNTLNSSDISSMVVLKDASATAIYGARGANGVIIIETKSGQSGSTQITYDGSYGWQNVISKMDMLNAYDFTLLQQEINPSLFRSQYLKPDGAGRETRTLDYYKNVPYIDWQEQAMRNSSMQNHSISMSGGNDKTRFSTSMNYMNQDGVVITSGFERFSGRLRLDHNVNKNFTVGVNAYYAQTKSFGATVRNASISFANDLTAMYNIWGYRPFSADKSLDDYLNDDIDEEIHGTSAGNRVNPIKTLNTEERNYFKYDLTASAYGQYVIAKDFTLRAQVGFNRSQGQNEVYYAPGHPATMLTGGFEKGINANSQYTLTTRIVNENTLTYNKVFREKHSVVAMLGFSAETYRYSNFRGETWNIPRDLGISGMDEGEAQPLDSRKTGNNRLSLFGRVQYNYDQRYYATVTYRADGSSKFPKGNTTATFPSFALMWRLSNEKFMQNVGIFDDIRLRASYGQTGNDRVGDHDFLAILNLDTQKGYSWGNGTPIIGAESTQIANSLLKWETTETTDFGIDLSMFDQRVALTVDYYNKETRDLLLRSKQPLSSGYSTAIMNIGAIRNRGWEFTLNTVNIQTKNFMWTSNFNISTNRSKVLALADGEPYKESSIGWNNAFAQLPFYTATVGQPVAMFTGLKWAGNYQINDFTWQNNSDPTVPHAARQYQLKDEVSTNGMARNQIKPGMIKYYDISDPDKKSIDDKDRTIIGDPNPKFTGGFSNNFIYGDFDLNVFFQFSYGNEIMNANRILFEGTYRYGLNQFASYAERWSPENPTNRNPIPAGQNDLYSDRTIEDGSYLRLKTVQLGYNIPQKVIKKIRLSKARVYFSAQNLFTWTNYSGFDPEVSINSSALTPSFDYMSYPRARTFTMGLSLTF